MTNDMSQSIEEDIKRAVLETKALAQENHRLLKKIKRHAAWDQVMSVIKILLIVVPMVIAYYFFAPQMKSLMNTYGNLMGMGDLGGSTGITTAIPQEMRDKVSPEMIEQLKKSGALEQYIQNNYK